MKSPKRKTKLEQKSIWLYRLIDVYTKKALLVHALRFVLDDGILDLHKFSIQVLLVSCLNSSLVKVVPSRGLPYRESLDW
jgi:hypothetical protein